MRWEFIFGPQDTAVWNSLPAGQAILARCQQLDPQARHKRTLMELLWAMEFYRDALYHSEYGAMINSGDFTGSPGAIAANKVTDWLQQQGSGKTAVTYRLRDWLISRQRYWGTPIPIVYCQACGQVPVPDDQLPVQLPEDVEWKPTGESPLKLHPNWSSTTCPKCSRPAQRDTDTMDTFMCSSWYHLRYLSPKFAQGAFDAQEFAYWMPVDSYTGGAEHATMHLIYTRFFHKVLRDLGITGGAEPMAQLRNQGQILGPDGQRMSKSRGNVIDPDAQVRKYGADTVRAYLMFGYRWVDGGPWGTGSIEGVNRWLNRVWALATEAGPAAGTQSNAEDARALQRITHQTIKKVSDDYESYEFNTIISALMVLTNALHKLRATAGASPAWEAALNTLLKLMAPATPHIAEELWAQRGLPYSIHTQAWPEYDAAAAAEEVLTLVVQINGKVRARITVPAGISEIDAKRDALAHTAVQRQLAGKQPQQVVYVAGRLVNIVL
jgi:leucyl-tRNA synthetase